LHKLKIIDYYEKLCQYIDKQNARKLVFISSSGALFNSNQNPGNVITEASIPLIVDGYGAATQIIEEILNSSQLFSKGKIVILRPTNVFGCNQVYKNNQGLIPRIFQALKYDEIISMNNDNSEKRDYLFIEDFLEATDLVSDKIGTFIISSHESKSSFEVLESIGARLPFSDARTRISLKSRDEFIYSPLRVSSTKFRLETGWQPSWNFETAIEKITESYLEHM
jgi:UDP-glucose 4-epimerase